MKIPLPPSTAYGDVHEEVQCGCAQLTVMGERLSCRADHSDHATFNICSIYVRRRMADILVSECK